MAILTRPTNYSDSIDNVLLVFPEIIKSIKAKIAAGETVASIIMEEIAAEFPHLVTAVGGLSDIPGDIAANRVVAFQTAGLRLGELVEALV